MNSRVLAVDSISKRFYLRNRPQTLRELSTRWLSGRLERRRVIWALRDVTFNVEQGVTLGIIGHNGAGKSTLLRILCGLATPTSGRIDRVGRISGLLELGGGFHPDLTGRENIMTAALLNGVTKRELKAAEDAIVAFAELEQFIDQPVRTYSSGMYLRLAFAVAMHFDPELLIIDEILSVGDSRFQKKCLERFTTFRKSGKTLILASHDSTTIERLCDRVLVLEEGRMVMQGEPKAALQCYNDLIRQRTEKRAADLSGDQPPVSLAVTEGFRQGTQEATISGIRFYDSREKTTDHIHNREGLTIELEYRLTTPVPDFAVTLGFFNEADVKCFEGYIPSMRSAFGNLPREGAIRCHFPEVPLLAGLYYVNAGLYAPEWDYIYDSHWQMHPLLIVDEPGAPFYGYGIVSLRPSWSFVTPTS